MMPLNGICNAKRAAQFGTGLVLLGYVAAFGVLFVPFSTAAKVKGIELLTMLIPFWWCLAMAAYVVTKCFFLWDVYKKDRSKARDAVPWVTALNLSLLVSFAVAAFVKV